MQDRRPSVLKPMIDPALEMSDSDMFWQENWRKFVWGLVLLVLAILLAGAWFLYAAHVRSSAESLYSNADGPDGWNALIAQFPGSIPAGNAQMRLASALRAEGNLGGATTELDKFIAQQPEHPLIGTAWLTLAELRLVQGDMPGALDAYRTASARQKDSFAAPLALLGEAKLMVDQGKEGEARAILESVSALYPETPAAMVAAGELSRMTKPAAAPAVE